MARMLYQVVLVTAIALAGSHVVFGDQCSTYDQADEMHWDCKIRLFVIKDSLSSFASKSEGVVEVYDKFCRNLNTYNSCMDEWSRNCSDRAAIMEAVSAFGFTCNGQGVVDWVKNNAAPAFDKTNYFCVLTVARKCNDVLQDVPDYPKKKTTTVEGIEHIKTYIRARFECFKQEAKALVPTTAACSGVTWQDVVLYDVVTYQGYLGEGFYTTDQINELKAMTPESR